MARYRRPPVPASFREQHGLYVWSRYWSQGAVAGSRNYRAGGRCSCGAVFGLAANRSNMDRAAVIDRHKDHVVDAYEKSLAGGDALAAGAMLLTSDRFDGIN